MWGVGGFGAWYARFEWVEGSVRVEVGEGGGR